MAKAVTLKNQNNEEVYPVTDICDTLAPNNFIGVYQ